MLFLDGWMVFGVSTLRKIQNISFNTVKNRSGTVALTHTLVY